MRHLFVIIDMSGAMNDQDLKPSRILTTLKVRSYSLEPGLVDVTLFSLGHVFWRHLGLFVRESKQLQGNAIQS